MSQLVTMHEGKPSQIRTLPLPKAVSPHSLRFVCVCGWNVSSYVIPGTRSGQILQVVIESKETSRTGPEPIGIANHGQRDNEQELLGMWKFLKIAKK